MISKVKCGRYAAQFYVSKCLSSNTKQTPFAPGNICSLYMPVTGFELLTFGTRVDRSANWATTTAQGYPIFT